MLYMVVERFKQGAVRRRKSIGGSMKKAE